MKHHNVLIALCLIECLRVNTFKKKRVNTFISSNLLNLSHCFYCFKFWFTFIHNVTFFLFFRDGFYPLLDISGKLILYLSDVLLLLVLIIKVRHPLCQLVLIFDDFSNFTIFIRLFSIRNKFLFGGLVSLGH